MLYESWYIDVPRHCWQWRWWQLFWL